MKWVMRAIQAVTLAVLMAGGAVLMAGGAGRGEGAQQSACYYCFCDTERRDSMSAARLERDKRLSACTDPLCMERVFREYRERLRQIEANYQLCLSWCYIGIL